MTASRDHDIGDPTDAGEERMRASGGFNPLACTCGRHQ